jgi:DNA-binding IclR family transcriptional regulator
VEKSFVVLETVTAAERPVGVSELSRLTGLPKSTVHRILAILVDFGLVRRGQEGYHPGRRLTGPAGPQADPRRTLLRERILPYLLDLYELTHETVQLATLQGAQVVQLDRLYGRRSAAAAARAIAAAPAHDTAIGRVLLAYAPLDVQSRYMADELGGSGRATASTLDALETELLRIRKQGVAVVAQEGSALGPRSAAAPVLGPDRQAVAAIAVTGSGHRVDARAVLALRRSAHEAALSVRDLLAEAYSCGRSAAMARSVTSSTGPVASIPSRMPFSA